MSEQNDQTPEDLVAFKLVQHFTMQGEASYDDFLSRVSALRVIALKLDQLRDAEAKMAKQEEYIGDLERELYDLRELNPISEEVMNDLDFASTGSSSAI